MSQATAKKAAQRIAVIGGGPAGLASCRFLVERGIETVVFESGSGHGGIWAPAAPNKVVYRGLVTNLPTVAMQSFDLDFPKGLNSYVKGYELGNYFASYAEHFSLNKCFRFRTEVTSVKPTSKSSAGSDAAASDAWSVEYRGEEGAGEETFDGVVVAKGHYDDPYVPEIPGQESWLAASASRRILHSREYDDPNEFKGKSVLVVGGRSSAVDVARELRGVANWVYVLEKGCLEPTSVGQCTHLPLGSSLSPSGAIKLPNGAQATGEPVDVVILATGYKYVFPFLDSTEVGLHFGPVERYIEPLYEHIVHVHRPSLCFAGIPLSVPTPLPLFEAQGRYIAAHFAGEVKTTESERQAWLEERKRQVAPRSQDLHFMSADSWPYIIRLTEMSGLSGKEMEAFRHRLKVVQEIYSDRVAKRPELPWDDDWFRRCEYTVDWETGKWEVVDPPHAQL